MSSKCNKCKKCFNDSLQKVTFKNPREPNVDMTIYLCDGCFDKSVIFLDKRKTIKEEK